jgi:hypothetical protein
MCPWERLKEQLGEPDGDLMGTHWEHIGNKEKKKKKKKTPIFQNCLLSQIMTIGGFPLSTSPFHPIGSH